MASSSLSVVLLLCLAAVASAGLSPATLYDVSCPKALSTIKTMVTNALSSDPRMGASLLRLYFHDCFVQGCDASVLLTTTGTEQSAGANLSLRGLDLIEQIKKAVEATCDKGKNTAIVSCADILAVAAHDSVVALGGPSWSWTVELGRKDSLAPSTMTAELPGPSSSLAQLMASFQGKGFSATDLVALSGAHTIGRAQCQNFRDRLYNEPNANINSTYAAKLKENCFASSGNTNLANLDDAPPTADTFDNGFFVSLMLKKGLLHSDQELFVGPTDLITPPGLADNIVKDFATDANLFKNAFASAMVKMGNLGQPQTTGQIRRVCYKAN